MVFDEFANQMSGEYRLFLFALSGRYSQMRAPGVEVTPYAITELKRDISQLAETFYQLAERSIDDYARELTAEASDELAKSIESRRLATLKRVRTMLAENVESIGKVAKTGVSGVAALLKNATGPIGMLVQKKAGIIEYKLADTSGRKWDAEKLMSVVVRDFAYQSWIDSEVERLMIEGVDIVATQNGHVMSLFGTPGYDYIGNVRGSVFHINSKQVIQHVPA